MARLKTETLEHHMRAERHPFMAAMIQGRLPVASYAEHLQQMLLVHEGDRVGTRSRAFDALVGERHRTLAVPGR
jgi:hypothetical protein